MHNSSYRLPRLVLLALAAAWLWGLTTPAGAGPIVLQDTQQSADAMVDTSKLVTLEHDDNIPNWDKPTAPSVTTKGPAKAGDAPLAAASAPAKPVQPNAALSPEGAASQPSLGKDLRSSIKETVRPVYDQLVESGAVEALHDVKEGLGLDKNQWTDQNKAVGEPKSPGQWDTPETSQAPRTDAQAQMDREMAGMMREKLIDQLTPWLAGLLGLYLLGFLIKLLYGYVRWRSARRNERLIKRAKRHTAHRSHSTGARTASMPLGTTSSTRTTTNESTKETH